MHSMASPDLLIQGSGFGLKVSAELDNLLAFFFFFFFTPKPRVE